VSAERDFALDAGRDRTQKATHALLPSAISDRCGLHTQDEFWEAVKQNIKDRLGLERYSIWFQQAELTLVESERLVIGVPNAIIQQFLTARYAEPVAAAAAELVGCSMAVSFDVAPRLFRQMRARQEAQMLEEAPKPAQAMAPKPAAPARVQEWGFENLIVTRANRLPFAAARELAGQENPRFRFIYICGDYGVGKTALLRATFALASGAGSSLNCILMSAEDWCNEYYHAIQRKATSPFRSRYRSCDVFLLDDIQFVQGKAAGQDELLHTVKHLLAKNGRVALAGAPHPDGLEELAPAFRALLAQAFPAVILPPYEDECREVVKQLARRWRLHAADEVHDLLAARFGDSFAKLESAVSCLSLYAGVEGCARMDLATATGALAALQPVHDRPVTLGHIKEAVAEALCVRPEQMAGRSRSRTVCRARHLALYLARKLTGASLTEIGRSFGGLSHSTVKHAVDKVACELQTGNSLSALVERIERGLQSRP
jgi:chromosomal replication initiator protein